MKIVVFSVSVSTLEVELVKVGFFSVRFQRIVMLCNYSNIFTVNFFEFFQCNVKLGKVGLWLITNVVGHISVFYSKNINYKT